MEEGMRNQELHRLKGAKGGFLSNPSKLAVTLLGILILLGLLIR
jgi:hypothetical protein